jgi:hypothetical protein
MKLTRLMTIKYYWYGDVNRNLYAHSCFVDACEMLDINVRKSRIYQNYNSAALYVNCIMEITPERPLDDQRHCNIKNDFIINLPGEQLIKFFYDKVVSHMLNHDGFKSSTNEIKNLLDMPHLFSSLIGSIKLKSHDVMATCYYSNKNQEFICNLNFKKKFCIIKISDSGHSIYTRKKDLSLKTDGDTVHLIYKKGNAECISNFMSLPDDDQIFTEIPRHSLIDTMIEVKIIIDFSSQKATWSEGGSVGRLGNIKPNFTFTFSETADVLNLPSNQNPAKINKYSTKINAFTKSFWKTIGRMKDADNEESIRVELAQLKPQKLADFQLMANFYMELLDNDDFSQHLKLHGDSDDPFSYVRGTVIMSGEEKFKAILAKPELIAEFDGEDTPLIESLEFMAEEVALEELGLSEEQWEKYLEKSKVDVSKL